jgi:ABC-type transport system involved in cytochrome c biogenesis permease subunit
MTDQAKLPVWFWIVGVIALLWNAMGVFAYLQQAMMSAEDFAALPEVQQNLLAAQPFWVTAAFAIAVFAGFVASIAWLLRKRVAVRLFLLSLLAVIVQFSGYFIIDEYMEFISVQGWTLPVLILVFAIVFLLISRHTEKKGFLR